MHMSFRDGVHTLVVGPREPTSTDFPAWSPEDTLLRAWLDGGDALLVDLRGVDHVHSKFLGFLVRLKALLSGQGGRLVLLVDETGLKESIHLLGLGRVFTLAEAWSDAVDACHLQKGRWLDECNTCPEPMDHD